MKNTRKLAAKRRNAQSSTGPRTDAGKAASSQNAVRHGLTGSFSVLAHESRTEFAELLRKYNAEFKPTTSDEEFLVEHMAQSRWTLARSRRIEACLLDQLAGAKPASDPDARIAASLLERSPNALATVERYTAAAERAYFRARRELTLGRSRELRNKANDAKVWLKDLVEQPTNMIRDANAQFGVPNEPNSGLTPDYSMAPGHPGSFTDSSDCSSTMDV